MNPTRLMLLVSLTLLAIFIAGCVTPGPGTNPNGNGNGNEEPAGMGWYAYSPVQADTNPWQTLNIPFVSAPTEEQLVQAWFSQHGIETRAFAFFPHHENVCEALNCPRGDLLLVDPANQASANALRELGFTLHASAFVYVRAGTEHYSVVLVNESASPLYYGGCNEFIPEILLGDGMPVPMPPKNCIWEGIPSVLNAHDTISFDWMPEKNGEYRVAVGYGMGCEPNTAMSEANCAQEGILYSNTLRVETVSIPEKILMEYRVKQCNTNPWQIVGSGVPVSAENQSAFTDWVVRNGLEVERVVFVPAGEDVIVCEACNCGTGAAFQIVISGTDMEKAEQLGFTYQSVYTAPVQPLDYAAATWYVYTPYQCFANLWNSSEDPVRSVEKDIRKLVEYLEGEGVEVTHTALIRGVTLSQQCTKKSTDKYGIGVTDEQSNAILSALAFVPAGTSQLNLFTSTEDVTPTRLLFRTKFCAAPPWGAPDLTIGNESAVQARVTEWLAENGITPLAPVTIHAVPVSATGSCDTDSGKAVLVKVPAWASVHLGAKGFLKPSTLFNEEKTQVYPVLATSETNNPETTPYETLAEYFAQVDYSCTVDSDCEIKDVHNACGYFPQCVNVNAIVDPEFVTAQAAEEGVSGVCGFPSINTCACVQNTCVGSESS